MRDCVICTKIKKQMAKRNASLPANCKNFSVLFVFATHTLLVQTQVYEKGVYSQWQATRVLGVNLKQGYNGDLTSKQAGSVGGQMVNVMCPVRTVQFQRTNWAKNNQLQPITYEFCIAV